MLCLLWHFIFPHNFKTRARWPLGLASIHKLKEILPFVTTYNPAAPNLKRFSWNTGTWFNDSLGSKKSLISHRLYPTGRKNLSRTFLSAPNFLQQSNNDKKNETFSLQGKFAYDLCYDHMITLYVQSRTRIFAEFKNWQNNWSFMLDP